jgi:putative flippase GtrA
MPSATRRARRALGVQAFRYVLAGGLLSLFGAAALVVVVAATALPAGLASLATQLAIAPLAYYTHRNYTFRSQNQITYEFSAFASVFALNYPLGAIIVFIGVDLLGVPTFVGGLLAAALLPLLNYALHTRWVFRLK